MSPVRAGSNLFLTVPEAAALARVAPKTIQFWIYSGRLPATKRGGKRLVREDVLIRWLDGEDVSNASRKNVG